ncbi:c-type cytochrome biogenesis protein CcsB [Spongiactinospora gelatinilytica]|uniref:C-type cytochrome biogenesis protein CcsB n=1 Tax=Spongiactinospora gelatinilytica TaxID=2666298 RepID=A0A2W2H7E4_9ACTN|nr:c-type cytochrome biogenesis protein CcsB [Spongiactinospora gelatinilytica]PZG55803.1 c-type cytochrome biogenesis protein CcsB [Spongiactinospora gelatinilytica]
MPAEVDTGLATLSDQLLLVTVLLYVFAMIGYALHLGFGRRSVQQAAVVREHALVGAGTSVPEAAPVVEPAPADDDTAGPRWPARAGFIALVLTWLGWAANAGCLVTRGLAVGRWPWANMYEFVVAICLATVTAYLVMRHKFPQLRFLGAFVAVAAALSLGFAVRYLHVQAGPVQPSLNSYWVAIHVSAAIIATGLFTVGGVTGIIYLFRKDGRPSRLPTRADLDRITNRVVVLAFPLWTFAVIAGALWADKAWGRYWGWDPKEIWAFITWIAYAAYLHARATGGWRGRAAMVVQLVAFGCLLFNLVGVNMFLGGLHSYADIPGSP